MFDTKIALVVREDLALWQKLNVTTFLTGGIVGSAEALIGEPYEDADGASYYPTIVQPVIILGANAAQLTRTLRRAGDRSVRTVIYIEDMFATGHDAANRESVKAYARDDLPLVGTGMRADARVVDKIVKGLKLHA